MTTDRRAARMTEVLQQRLSRVSVAMEALYHRHNLSAILRTCDALGVHTVHQIGGGRPSLGPARGAARWLDLCLHDDPLSALSQIRAGGARLYVADLAGDAITPEAVPVDRAVCLWFGAELVGVAAEARAAADGVVTVPMRGMVQSLNVSVAAALVIRPVAERARAQGDPALLDPLSRERILAEWLARDV
jgi:tRNA (guanosine-2'-O-)-methyltransferase